MDEIIYLTDIHSPLPLPFIPKEVKILNYNKTLYRIFVKCLLYFSYRLEKSCKSFFLFTFIYIFKYSYTGNAPIKLLVLTLINIPNMSSLKLLPIPLIPCSNQMIIKDVAVHLCLRNVRNSI